MSRFLNHQPGLERNGLVINLQLGPNRKLIEDLRRANLPLPRFLEITAMIDTGARGTVIKWGLAEQLGLAPADRVFMKTPTSAGIICSRYKATLVFSEDLLIERLVTAAPLPAHECQCLIGRDILRDAVFTYGGKTETFSLFFE